MYKNIFSCKGKVAVVTGGCGLIGKEIVKGLSDFGARVFIADIDKEKAVRLCQEAKAEFTFLDISSEESVKKAIEEIISQSGRIDVLINSAYPRTGDWNFKFQDVAFGSWCENINSHLGGYFLCCRKAAETMKRQKKGAIINLSSVYGLVAPDFSIYEETDMTMPVAYSSIKAGIIALTKYIASYYSRYNIRANSISPGGIFNRQNPVFVKRYSKKTPLGRMGKPEDVVAAVIYLASDASSYMTGCNLIIDGGWTVL